MPEVVENEYRVIGPPGCVAGDAIIEINRGSDAGVSTKVRLDALVSRFNLETDFSFRRGNHWVYRKKPLWNPAIKTMTRSLGSDGRIVLAPVVAAVKSGLRAVSLLTLSCGRQVRLTRDHEVLTSLGKLPLSCLKPGDCILVDGGKPQTSPYKKRNYRWANGLIYHPNCRRRREKRYTVLKHRAVVEAEINGVDYGYFLYAHKTGIGLGDRQWRYLDANEIVHHKDGDIFNNSLENLEVIKSSADHTMLHFQDGGWENIVAKAAESEVFSIEECGEAETFDLTVGHPTGSGNYLANGILVSNCGKTTYLAGQTKTRVEAWCERTGEPSTQCNDVLVSSLTRAAAAEVSGRGLKIPKEQIGTLHAHALRALGSPKLCVSPKSIAEWNKQSGLDYRLSGAAVSKDSQDEWSLSLGTCRGDTLLAEYTLNRCRLIPREKWSSEVTGFADAYERWKRIDGTMDFEDLIHEAIKRDVNPPGNPSTIMSDEGQDSSLAEFALLRQWAKKVNKLIIVGDSDQAIFRWRGADPDGFYASEIPDGHTKVLEQSFGVPRAVHSAAMSMVSRIADRKQVVYHPRDEDGEVTTQYFSMRSSPHDCVTAIEKMLDEPDTDPRRPKVMALFSCSYMAQPLLDALRARGVPTWNPFSADRGPFNPLHPSKGVSTLDRVRSFLRPNEECYGEQAAIWTWSEFNDWIELVSAEGWLRHGAKAEIKRRSSANPTGLLSVDDLDKLLSSAAIMEELSACDISFLSPRIVSAKQASFDYISEIVRRRGYKAITNNPRVVVSTIHGAKGSESDNVLLCPDLSSSGWEQFGKASDRDAIFRLYYVGMTRAYQRLHLTLPSSSYSVNW
jgi:superfamily I DNA/RNA helicase